MSKFMLTAKVKTEVNFVTPEGKIDVETLKSVFDTIVADAEKSNANNGAAGTRFRINTVALSKEFTALRKLAPVK